MDKTALKKSFNIAYMVAFLTLLPVLLLTAYYTELKPGLNFMLFAFFYFLLALFVTWIIGYRVIVIRYHHKS